MRTQWQTRQRSLAQRDNITAISILIVLNYYLGELLYPLRILAQTFGVVSEMHYDFIFNPLWFYF